MNDKKLSGDLFTYCAARFATIAVIARDTGDAYIQRLAEEAVEEMGQRVLDGTADKTAEPCAECLEAQSLITDFDSEISDGDVPDRLGDLLPRLRSAADAMDMVRTATLLHKRNCECEACYWIGRSPLAQQQANAHKAAEQQA